MSKDGYDKSKSVLILANTGASKYMECKVEAFWDEKAKVWVVTSDDVSGLATEANSLEILTRKLHNMIPELMIANNVIPSNYTGKISLELVTHRQELIEVC